MYFYIYKTTNTQNGKYYVGKHIGRLDDDYLGSGKLLKQAIKNYGKSSFKKEVQVICLNEKELNYWEKKIVLLKIKDPNCYNLTPGGEGGYVTKYFTQEQKDRKSKKASKSIKEYRKKHPEEVRQRHKQQRKTLMKGIEKHKEKIRKSLAQRTPEEVKLQHEKATKTKLKNGHYNVFEIYSPEGVLTDRCIGAEKLAEKYNVSANGIRLAAKHGNPIVRGNLEGYTVRKKREF